MWYQNLCSLSTRKSSGSSFRYDNFTCPAKIVHNNTDTRMLVATMAFHTLIHHESNGVCIAKSHSNYWGFEVLRPWYIRVRVRANKCTHILDLWVICLAFPISRRGTTPITGRGVCSTPKYAKSCGHAMKTPTWKVTSGRTEAPPLYAFNTAM